MLTGSILVPIIVTIGALAVIAGVSDENHRREGVRRG